MAHYKDIIYRPGGYTNQTMFSGNEGGRAWFVDYGNGNDSFSGERPEAPIKYLQTALTNCSKWDVIFHRPYTVSDVTAGSPNAIKPASTTNWTIASTKQGVQIIGTSPQHGIGGKYTTCLQGADSGTTDAFYIKGPFIGVENLSFHRGSSGTGSALKIRGGGYGSADYAFQNSVYNCIIIDNDYGAGGKSTGLIIDDAWYSQVEKCTFLDLGVAINLGASTTVPQGMVIRNCDFQGLTADIKCDIFGVGAVYNILITECNFNHVLPTGGSPNLYIIFTQTSSGIFSNSFMGATASTVGTNTTLNGVTTSGVYTYAGLLGAS